jgi:plastocyanin
MYRFLQAVLLAAIAAYIAWMTIDLQSIHQDLRRMQDSIARLSTVRKDTRPHKRATQRSISKRVDVTTAGLAYAFKPRRLLVKVGTKITWVNLTAASHSVTSIGSRYFDRIIRPRSRVTVVFRSIGAFPYYCRFHPYQRGEIIVVP